MMAVQQFFIFLLVLCLKVLCAPMPRVDSNPWPSDKVISFMKTYGYIESDDSDALALYTEEGLSDVIRTVQRFGGVEETGKIDNATLKLLSSRRCGVPDVIRNHRKRRYAFGSEGWSKRNLTYFIANWSPRLGEQKVMKNIQKALDTWGGYGRLTFRRVPNQDADIVVAFATGAHGDAFPFEGPGGVLAHAFFPYEGSDTGGDIHFDADEIWIDISEENTKGGTDFYSVALHELGHSLGLSHSPVSDSIMFPYYRDYEEGTGPQLGYDDILGMYNLYITRTLKEDVPPSPSTDHYETSTFYTSPSTEVTEWWYNTPTQTYETSETQTSEYSIPSTKGTTEAVFTYEGDDETVDDHKDHDKVHNIPKTNAPSLPNICDGYVDAIAMVRNELLVFKEQFVWRYKEKGELISGYPVSIFQMFPTLPKTIKKIDAAYERPDGMLIFFTGKEFWVSDGSNFVEGSPKPLTYYGLPEYLNDIDAVQLWARNGKTYFYKSDRFWRYNEATKSMDPGYPLHLERWRGVPENLDAANTWKDGSTYFFKAELFWKFDNNWVIVTEQSPLPTAQIWFGCPEDEQSMIRLLKK